MRLSDESNTVILIAVTAKVQKSVASKRGRARRQVLTLRCVRKDTHSAWPEMAYLFIISQPQPPAIDCGAGEEG
jgi:hypothetical protein